MKPNGIIVYEGLSKFDNKPIVVIVTGTARKSQNSKTGNNVLQTWIIKRDINPFSAFVTGKDKSVCGNCKHSVWGTCYVNKAQAVYQVYNAYKKGKYPKIDCYNVNLIKGKSIRFGSYGEPASVDIHVWDMLSYHAKDFVGYTHSWSRKSAENLKPYCMASCDTEKEKKIALLKGWKTFRIRTPDEKLFKDEMACPASLEAGRKTNCSICKSCCGLSSKNKKNIAIIAHGLCHNKFVKIMSLRKNHRKISHLFVNKH
jgi:hypothetical protein